LHGVHHAVCRLAYNGMAAWRSGGIPALPFKSARPAAVAPNRSLSAGILPSMLSVPILCWLILCRAVLNSTALSVCTPFSAHETLSVWYSIPLLCRLILHCRCGTQLHSIVGLQFVVGTILNPTTLCIN